MLSRAQAELRLVLTHDKDFGELAFRFGLPVECGIVLLRSTGSDPDAGSSGIANLLGSRSDWTGHFRVIEPDRIRLRPLPRAAPSE